MVETRAQAKLKNKTVEMTSEAPKSTSPITVTETEHAVRTSTNGPITTDRTAESMGVGLIIWPAGSWADGGPPGPLEKSSAQPVMGFEMARSALGQARLGLGCLKPDPTHRPGPIKPKKAQPGPLGPHTYIIMYK
ncbi:unnamed protein product [Prunus armeniaca]